MKSKQSAVIFGKYISIIHRHARTFFDRKLAEDNISSGQIPFIFQLCQTVGLSQDELSNLLGMDKTTTARAVKSLVELGYVLREHDSGDQRMYRLCLTSEGKALLPKIRGFIMEWNSAISTNLSPEEKDRLQQGLKKLSENARHFKDNNFKPLT